MTDWDYYLTNPPQPEPRRCHLCKALLTNPFDKEDCGNEDCRLIRDFKSFKDRGLPPSEDVMRRVMEKIRQKEEGK